MADLDDIDAVMNDVEPEGSADEEADGQSEGEAEMDVAARGRGRGRGCGKKGRGQRLNLVNEYGTIDSIVPVRMARNFAFLVGSGYRSVIFQQDRRNAGKTAGRFKTWHRLPSSRARSSGGRRPCRMRRS